MAQAASVESAFVLLDRASGPIRRIRGELRETRMEAERTGKALDNMSGPRQGRQLERQARELHQVEQGANSAEREIAGMARSMDSGRRSARSFGGELRVVGNTIRAVGAILRLARFPAIAAGIGLLTQAVGGLAAGAVALAPAVGQASGVAAAGIPLFVGLGAAMVVTKLATNDLSKAYGGNREALKRLTPEGRSFLQTLKSYKPVVEDLRRTSQRGLFPGLNDALTQLRTQRGQARRIVGQTAGDLGNSAREAGNRLGGRSPQDATFMRDVAENADIGGRAVGSMTRATTSLARALTHVGVASGPFVDHLGRGVERLAKMAENQAQVGRETGRLDSFFIRAERSLDRFGRIGGNVWGGMRGLFRASRQEGDGLWDSIEKITQRWEDWSNSANGQADMRRYFAEMRPVLKETVGLTGDLAKAMADISRGPEAAEGIREIRRVVPDLSRAISTLTTQFGPVLIRTFASFLSLLAELSGHGSPLALFVGSLGALFDVATKLVQVMGPLGTAMATFLGANFLMRRVAGVNALSGAFGRLTGNARASARAQQAAGAGIAPGGRAGGPMLAMGPGGRPVPAGGGMSPGGVVLPPGVGRGGAVPRGGAAAGAGAALMARGRQGAAWARSPGSARAAGGAAARFAGPTALLMGLMGAAGTKGDFAQRLQGGASGLTLGLVPGPTLPSDRLAGAGTEAQRTIGGLNQRQDLGAQRGNVRALEKRIQFAPGDDRLDQKNVDMPQYLKALRTELGLRRDILRETTLQKRAELDRRDVGRANRMLTDLGKAFDIRRARQGPVMAMRHTTKDMLGQLRTLRPAGQKVLAENTLAWARQQARSNPRLVGVVRRLEGQIKNSFARTGTHVEIVNGKILTGSRAEWRKISRALTSSSERARQEVSSDFTAMQRQAVGSLTAMGFSPSEARSLIKDQEKGGLAGRSARGDAKKGPTGAGQRPSTSNRNQARAHMPGMATGGRLTGTGLRDEIEVAPGQLAAPKELVVNRHTEADTDRDLRSIGRPPLGQRVGRERRRHGQAASAPNPLAYLGGTSRPTQDTPAHAFGGRLALGGAARARMGGATGGAWGSSQRVVESFVPIARRHGAVPGSRKRATQSTASGGTSDHWTGNKQAYAIDFMTAGPRGDAFARAAGQALGTGWTGGSWLNVNKGGYRVQVGWRVPGHYDHVHIGAKRSGAGGGWVAGPGGGGGAGDAMGGIGQINIKPRTSRQRGLPGAAVNQANRLHAAGLNKSVNERLAKMGGTPGGAGGGSYSGPLNRDFGRGSNQTISFNQAAMLAEKAGLPGISYAEIAKGESGLRPGAVSPDGGFGLWQMTPRVQSPATIAKWKSLGSYFNPWANARMAKALAGGGSGLSNYYGKGFYSGGAKHYKGDLGGMARGGRVGWGGWNARGGDFSVDRPTLFGAGENGKERVRISPQGSRAGRGSGARQVTGPLVRTGDIRIDGGGSTRQARKMLREELDRFAATIDESLQDGSADVDEDKVLS